MNKQELTNEIKKLAQEENIDFVKACQAMQSAAAQLGNEDMITVIHEIKMNHLNIEGLT